MSAAEHVALSPATAAPPEDLGSAPGSETPTPLEIHAHQWRRIVHMDGCHWFSSTFACECGASREIWNERDVGYDSYSTIWMVREDGEESCDRCDALMSGAKPESRDETRGAEQPPVAERTE